jgi:hypothetical protein
MLLEYGLITNERSCAAVSKVSINKEQRMRFLERVYAVNKALFFHYSFTSKKKASRILECPEFSTPVTHLNIPERLNLH